MKTLSLLSILALILTSCGTKESSAPRAIAQDAEIEKQIKAELGKMTLREKVGQTCELTIDVLGHLEGEHFVFDEEKILSAIKDYKVGSILNAPGRAITQEEWKNLILKIQELSMEYIGIPCLYGVDQNHGTTYTIGGTLFPQNINLAATFNPELTRRGAEICAYETRACEVPWTYSPTIDLSRDQRWPRCWENYGEDAYLSSVMAKAATLGFQGDDPNHIDSTHIGVSLKHFMGYGAPRSGKDRTPSNIGLNEMREKHFAPFAAAVRAGALTIMVNSANNNGEPLHASHRFLTEWLKEGLNWDGMIVTDWADIMNLYNRDHIASSKKEAIKIAFNAGIDMSMDPYSTDHITLLEELVNEGEVSMERLDDAVRRVLRVKHRLGLYERYSDIEACKNASFPEFASEEHSQASTEAAIQSMVLLKNTDKTLPLPANAKILLCGPNANNMRCLNGGWSYTWQGHLADRFAGQYNTILEAMQNEFGAKNITYIPGVEYVAEGSYFEEKEPKADFGLPKIATGFDYIVCCVGENSYCETPGNLNDLDLSTNQQNLIKALAKYNKPIVLILNEGRGRLINDVEPLASAIVDIMIPGNYGGDALVKLLSGKENFSGRLPFTYPRYQSALATYDYKPCEKREVMSGAYNYDADVTVQWPFGYGLSYSTFEYSDITIAPQQFAANDSITVTLNVKNSGDTDGKHSVLVYSSDLVASLTPDVRRLRAFCKVDLKAGESELVTMKIAAKDLAFVGMDDKWHLEKGTFRIQIGELYKEIECLETVVF